MFGIRVKSFCNYFNDIKKRMEMIETIKISPFVVLPLQMRIPASGTHFYKMGFSNFKNGCTERLLLYHPIFVFTLPTIYLLRFIYSILTPNRTQNFYLAIGDFGYFMNMRVHLNLTAALVFWMAILSQAIHFYNYLTDRRPTYMCVFNMMSGHITPQSIGLTDETIIRSLLKRSTLAFKAQDIMGRSMIIMAFFLSFFSYVFTVSPMAVLLIALPHSAIFGLGVSYVMNNICTHLFYFYILSYYLKLKQKEVNDFMRYAIENKDRIKILNSKRITDTLNQIYEEIIDYDSNYWSKFIAVVWSSCTTVVALVIFIFAFGNNMHFNIRFILFYCICFYSTLLLLLIEISASVNLETEKTYKLLASYKLVTTKTRQPVTVMARHGFKVRDFSVFEFLVLDYI